MNEHQSQTGQIKKIKLESSIQQVYWTRRAAAPGGTIGLEVFTHYVGNNSEIKIDLTDKSGKSHGNFTDKIHGNHFWGPVKVPANAKEELYATVKLPKHSLSQKSGPLIILPLVEITNAKWDKKEARRGDILKLTADIKGVPDGVEAFIEIWEHDADGVHDFVTKFPVQVKSKKIEAEWEFEYHEDTDDIPSAGETEKGYHTPEYFFRVRAGEVTAESGLLEFKDWVEIQLIDDRGNIVPHQRYRVTLPDGTTREGELDDNAKARLEDIPPGNVTIIYPGAVPTVTQEQVPDVNNVEALRDPDLAAADNSDVEKIVPTDKVGEENSENQGSTEDNS
jgi:hypothetical protein